MIYSLTGYLTEKNIDNVVIDVNGIGFKVGIPLGESLPRQGDLCTLYTYMSVREDSMDLYGFSDKASRECFEILISVSGVGPKVALSVLSVMSPSAVALAVASGDSKAFTAANGIGPKVARRITLELKDKFKSITFDTGSEGVSAIENTVQAGGNVAQAINALVSLGYTQSQSTLAVSKLDPSLSLQELIKQALRLIAGGKL
jgi:Holliday junction DNA helicase RuvA